MDRKLIHTVFEWQAKASPDSIAIEHDEKIITYHALNSTSNTLASLIAEVFGRRKLVVGVRLKPGIAQVCAMLALFKSGNIYMPVTDGFSERYWEKIFGVIRPDLFITDGRDLEAITFANRRYPYQVRHVIAVDANSFQIERFEWRDGEYKKAALPATVSGLDTEIAIDAGDGCYLFFTSGTSGVPKAVMGQHKSLSHFIHWEGQEFQVTRRDRVSQLTSITFDASLRDIFLPLSNGACLFIPPDGIKEDPVRLIRWICEKGISIVHTVPSVFRKLCAAGEGQKTEIMACLRHILLAGEMLYYKDVQKWHEAFGDSTEIVNLYGPTEATMIKTFFRVGLRAEKADQRVPAGRPISSTAILVISDSDQLCEPGELGNIYIKTPFLTKGYYMDEDQTGQVFVQNPLEKQKKEIVYRTGDYGKYLPDYSLEVIGRKDAIVKLRGVRVDLNDVESVLLGYPLVKNVKCLLAEVDGEETIRCYYCGDDLLDEGGFYGYAKHRLTRYELPGFFHRLLSFPLNTNGKTDITALAAMHAAEKRPKRKVEEPDSEIKRVLFRIWAKVLPGESEFSSTDDFFMVGGNSFRLHQLTRKIDVELGVKLNLGDLFSAPTLEQQARLIAGIRDGSPALITLPPGDGSYPLTPSQMRIWMSSLVAGNSLAHNMPRLVGISGALDIAAMGSAFGSVIARHEILRTVFRMENDGEIRQIIRHFGDVEFALSIVDAAGDAGSEQVSRQVRALSSRLFDLASDLMIKATIIKLEPDNYILHYMVHHIAADEESLAIILRDLIQAYLGLICAAGPGFTGPEARFRDFATASNRPDADRSKQDREYWQSLFSKSYRRFQIPGQLRASEMISHAGGETGFRIEDLCRERIYARCQADGATLVVFFLSALYVLLSKYSGSNDIVIGLPVSTRSDQWRDVAGPFVDMTVVRCDLDPGITVNELFTKIREQVAGALRHMEYPFEQVVDLMATPDGTPVQVAVNMVDYSFREDHTPRLDGLLKVREMEAGYERSKFPLCLYVLEYDRMLDIRFEYSGELFEKSTIEVLTGRFQNIINALLNNPEKSLFNLSVFESSKSFNLFS